MNILLTASLLNFLAKQGCTCFLSQETANQHALTQLTPVWSVLHLRRLQHECATLLSIKDFGQIPDTPDKRSFFVAVDKTTLLCYIASLIKTPQGRKD